MNSEITVTSPTSLLTDVIWIFLLALTGFSFWFSESNHHAPFITSWVLVIAILKVILIGFDFMDLRHSSKLLLSAFILFFLVLGLALLLLFWS